MVIAGVQKWLLWKARVWGTSYRSSIETTASSKLLSWENRVFHHAILVGRTLAPQTFKYWQPPYIPYYSLLLNSNQSILKNFLELHNPRSNVTHPTPIHTIARLPPFPPFCSQGPLPISSYWVWGALSPPPRGSGRSPAAKRLLLHLKQKNYHATDDTNKKDRIKYWQTIHF